MLWGLLLGFNLFLLFIQFQRVSRFNIFLLLYFRGSSFENIWLCWTLHFYGESCIDAGRMVMLVVSLCNHRVIQTTSFKKMSHNWEGTIFFLCEYSVYCNLYKISFMVANTSFYDNFRFRTCSTFLETHFAFINAFQGQRVWR